MQIHHRQSEIVLRWWESFLVFFGIHAIIVYQKLISPLKGFRCAHKALHGGDSCSEYGKNILIRHGVRRFVPMMRERFRACNDAWRELMNQSYSSKNDVLSKSDATSSNEADGYKDAQCCVSTSAKKKVDAACDAVACCWEIKG